MAEEIERTKWVSIGAHQYLSVGENGPRLFEHILGELGLVDLPAWESEVLLFYFREALHSAAQNDLCYFLIWAMNFHLLQTSLEGLLVYCMFEAGEFGRMRILW